MEQIISKTELNNIRSSDKRLVSINDSGVCSTIIIYVGALRIRDDALLYRPHNGGGPPKLKYPYSNVGTQSYGIDGNILEEYEHGYGILPFVFTHREEQIDEFFVDGANDIVDCNEQVNIAMTEMQLGLRFQMFGQPYMTGVD